MSSQAKFDLWTAFCASCIVMEEENKPDKDNVRVGAYIVGGKERGIYIEFSKFQFEPQTTSSDPIKRILNAYVVRASRIKKIIVEGQTLDEMPVFMPISLDNFITSCPFSRERSDQVKGRINDLEARARSMRGPSEIEVLTFG